MDACDINNDLALGEGGSYIGSCDDGGNCDDSVYNKLLSANNKVDAEKILGACENLASIQDNLNNWLNASKPKIDQDGFDSLSAAVTALKDFYSCP
ncbi:MAG: hypothetical protein ACU84H_13690 [Gammaproteobacteria bacterium]